MTSNDGSNRNDDHHHIKEAISFEEGLDIHSISAMVKKYQFGISRRR
ncbi:MAG TPA: hypothetical protein VIW25_14305 [Nitrososphaeraceae archaeon]